MTTDHLIALAAAIILNEIVVPYAQMTSVYEVPQGEEELSMFDFWRALQRYTLVELVGKFAAFGTVALLFFRGELVGGILLAMGVGAVNGFYLARRKLDRSYQALNLRP
jgi:hypothetical protein